MRAAIIFILFLTLSCQNRPTVDPASYYNVDSLISAQQAALQLSGASLNKSAYMGADSAHSSFKPDSILWENELNVFKKADINNPTLKGLYSSLISDDTNSNLTIQILETTNNEAEVKYLKLYYLDNISKLRKLEALWIEKNPIYSSQRKLVMTFDEIHDEILLKHYEIKGTQKMMLQDSVRFEVIGDLNFN